MPTTLIPTTYQLPVLALLMVGGAIAWAAQDAPEGVAQADRLLGLVLNGLRCGVR